MASLPDSIASRRGSGSLHIFLILFVVLAALFVARRPDALTNAQFWAEDGSVMFHDDIVYGGIPSLFRQCAGYIQPIPRVIAALAGPASAMHAPLIYNLCALLIDAACCSLFILARYRMIIRSDVLRGVLCLLAGSAFQASEVVSTVINTQWYLLIPVMLLVAVSPRAETIKNWHAILWSVAAFCLGFSVPISIVALPVVLFQAFRGGFPMEKWATQWSLVAGAGLQTLMTLVHPSGLVIAFHPEQTLSALLIAFVYRIVWMSIFGFARTIALAQKGMLDAVLLTLVVLAAWLAWLLRVSRGNRRRQVVATIYFMFAFPAMALIARNLYTLFPDLVDASFGADRYFLVSSCLFALLVAFTLENQRQFSTAVNCGVLILIFLGGIAGNFSIPSLANLQWRTYARQIDARSAAAREGKFVPTLSVPINPRPWHIDFPEISDRNSTDSISNH